MKKTFQIFISSLTISALVLPSFSYAQLLPEAPLNPSEALFGDYSGSGSTGPTIPNSETAPATTPSTVTAPSANPLPSLTPPKSSQKSPAQLLADSRKEDRKQCEAEVSGSGAGTIGQLVGNEVKETLNNALFEEIGKAAPAAVNQAIVNMAPAIQQGIREEMPSIVTEGLKEQLPLTLMEKIQLEMATNDIAFAELQGTPRFNALVRESIDETLPGVIRDGLYGRLPNIIDKKLDVEIPNTLRIELNRVARPTIENHFRAQINSLIAALPRMIAQQVRDLQDTIKGTTEGIRALMSSLGSKGPIDLAIDVISFLTSLFSSLKSGTGNAQDLLCSIPEICQMQALLNNLAVQFKATQDFIAWASDLIKHQDELVNSLVSGFTASLSQSLTNPKAIAHLADAISDAMTDPINRAMENSIDNIERAIEEPINRAINRVNGLPDRLFAPINDALNDVSNLIDLEIQTIVHLVTNPIVSTIDVVGNEIATAIDSGLESVLSPVLGGAESLTSSLGNDIAFSMRAAALETHVALFGGDAVFETLGPEREALWPNGVADLPQPPTYLPVTPSPIIDDGLFGPPAPDDIPFGPPGPAPGEAFLPEPVFGPEPFLTNDIGELANVAAEETIASTETVVEQALPTESGGVLTANLDSTLLSATTGVFGAGMGALFAGIPGGQFLASMATKVFTNLISNSAFGAAGAALSVPVNEIGALLAVNQNTDTTTGKILQTNEQIKAMTEKIYSLQVQACTHLKVIRRVQLSLETKELLNDPNARKSNAAAIHKHQLDFIDFLNNGRSVSEAEIRVTGNNKKQLWVTNYGDHLAEAEREAGAVFYDHLKQLEKDQEKYPNLKTVRQSLEAESNQTLGDRVGGTLTKTQVDKFRDDPKSLDNKTYWETFRQLGRPENNIYGQTLIAQDLRNQQQAAAAAAAAAEYSAGGGFVGTRECLETTTDGKNCVKWQTLTPPAAIRDYSSAALKSPLDQAIVSDENIEDFMKNEVSLNANRVKDLKNAPETAKQSVFNSSDPCPGPGPCQGSGWPKNTSSSKPSGSGGSGSSFSFPPFSTGSTPAPLNVIFISSSPTIAEVRAGATNTSILKWDAPESTSCVAKNDWPTKNTSTYVKLAGQNLGANGQTSISSPVTFQAVFSRVASAGGEIGPILTDFDIATNLLKDRIIFNPVNTGNLYPGDTFRLTIYGGGAPVNLTVGGPGTLAEPTPAAIINLFSTEISNEQEKDTRLGRELRKFVFAYFPQNDGSGYLTMSPKLTYQMTCTRGDEVSEKEVTLYRAL